MGKRHKHVGQETREVSLRDRFTGHEVGQASDPSSVGQGMDGVSRC